MPETKNRIKEYLSIVISVIAIMGALGTYGSMKAKNAVLEDTVRRHEVILNQYNIPVMNEQMKNISEDVSELKEILIQFTREYNVAHTPN